MHAAIQIVARDLMNSRACSFADALVAIASTYEENLRDSSGTTMENYWQIMLEVAQSEIADLRSEREHMAPVSSLLRGPR